MIVVLIQRPAIDFDRFIGACHTMLGYNPAQMSDKSSRSLSDTERFLSCLAAFGKPDAPLGLSHQGHVMFSVLLAAFERDLLDIIECATGMPFVIADTKARGVTAAVISGTLEQWREAVRNGTNSSLINVRGCFCKIMELFHDAGLGGVWKDFDVRPSGDNTFRLEDKRR